MAREVALLDVRIDAVDLATAMQAVRGAIRADRPSQIVTVNVDFLKLAKADPAYRRLLNTSDLAVADGMPLIWASRLLGTPLPQRITGMDIMLGCCAMAAAEGHQVYLLGAAPGVADTAAQRLEEQFPGLQVCGTYAPPFGPFTVADDARMVRQIRAARPDMLFVAFGAPRQDVWIREHMAELGVPVSVGVGGTFNFIAGSINRAPAWMQDAGLEWLHRLVQEPGRLWKRYLLQDLPVFLQLLAQPRIAEEVAAGLPGPAPLSPARQPGQQAIPIEWGVR